MELYFQQFQNNNVFSKVDFKSKTIYDGSNKKMQENEYQYKYHSRTANGNKRSPGLNNQMTNIH